MNIYFLVEGRRTEKKVYPKWISQLIPKLTEINDPFKVKKGQYYIFSGNGFPSLLDNHLTNTIADINTIKKFDYLVICLDSDDDTIELKKQQINDFIKKNKLVLLSCELVIIVQNKCFESWFLGNKKIYSRQPQSKELKKYNKFYNVQTLNPEDMGKMDDFETSAQFHEAYLCEMFREKKIHYSKKKPEEVTKQHYLSELIDRTKTNKDLLSFKTFLLFCEKINKLI